MSHKKKIAVIGAGQLGSRHLQALTLLEDPAEIWVIDPNPESRELAHTRLEEMKGKEKHTILIHSGLESLPHETIDMVVIATNSAIRYQVLKTLLSLRDVRYLILEKFLFQKQDHFQEVAHLLAETGTLAFVNCPRRMFPVYQEIAQKIEPGTSLQLEVVGNNWGLGCNGIHFVDLFRFLSGETIEHWHNRLDPSYQKSKREGYIEFTGTLTGIGRNNQTLTLTSHLVGKPNTSIRISTPSNRWVVAEGLGRYWHEEITLHEIKITEKDYQPLFQSMLTHGVARELFKRGNCKLTPFAESSALHQPFLSVLLEHYNKTLKNKTEICPIT